MLGGVVAVTLAAAAAIAWAQHGHGSMGAEGHQVAQACATEFEKVVSDGRGFGLAFAADQNGYPARSTFSSSGTASSSPRTRPRRCKS